MPLRDRLTQIGTVTLPVYALSLRGAPNLAGFSFLRFADCMAEVSSDADVKIGSIGGIVGAHYLIFAARDDWTQLLPRINHGVC